MDETSSVDREVRAELERVQKALALEREARRRLEEALVVRAPKTDLRPDFLPWVVAVLVGIALGAWGHYMIRDAPAPQRIARPEASPRSNGLADPLSRSRPSDWIH